MGESGCAAHYQWLEEDPTYLPRLQEARIEATQKLSDEAVRRPELLGLLGRIELEAGWEGHAADPIEVTLRLTDGTTETAQVNPLIPVPDAALPAQWASLVAKFTALAEPVVGRERAAGVLQGVSEVMESGSVADLLALTRADLAHNRDND